MLPKIHLSIERWRKNTEYGVWVSNHGNVKLIKNKQSLNPRICETGYCTVFTEKGAIMVHRLVAYTWLGGKRNDKYNIDHINSNKRDNSVKNLRWIPREINLAYADFTKCSEPVEEPVEDPYTPTSIEEEEDILSILSNTSLLPQTRFDEFMRVFKENKIELRYDNHVIKSYEELKQVQTKHANNQQDEVQFVKRILTVANKPVKYCGKYWQIKVIK